MEENSCIEEKEPKEEFYKLLYIEEPRRYILRINDKYKKYMDALFWNTIIKYFHSVYFVVLPDDIFYECEDTYFYKEK